MVTQKLRMGPQEMRLFFNLEKKKMSLFTFSDAKKILNSTNSSTWNVIDGLKKKKRLKEIEKGKYLLVPGRAGNEGYWAEESWIVVPHLIDEYYIAFWTAMNYWDMTEQIPYTVFVATTKRKRDLEFGNQTFQFVTLSKNKFFGFVEEKRGNTMFNISSIEKTIVDGLMHPEYCGGITEVAKGMWNVREKVDWNTVLNMSKKIGKSTVLKRLGYLLSVLEIEKEIVHLIKLEQFKGSHYLDPTAEKKRLDYSGDFSLIINKTKNELTSWMQY